MEFYTILISILHSGGSCDPIFPFLASSHCVVLLIRRHRQHLCLLLWHVVSPNECLRRERSVIANVWYFIVMIIFIVVDIIFFLQFLFHLLPHKLFRDPPDNLPTPIDPRMQLRVCVVAASVHQKFHGCSRRQFRRLWLELGPPLPPPIVLGLPPCSIFLQAQRGFLSVPPGGRRRGRQRRFLRWHLQR